MCSQHPAGCRKRSRQPTHFSVCEPLIWFREGALLVAMVIEMGTAAFQETGIVSEPNN
jgi:hypothetical protein